MLVRDKRTSSANGAFGRHERRERNGMRLVIAAPRCRSSVRKSAPDVARRSFQAATSRSASRSCSPLPTIVLPTASLNSIHPVGQPFVSRSNAITAFFGTPPDRWESQGSRTSHQPLAASNTNAAPAASVRGKRTRHDNGHAKRHARYDRTQHLAAGLGRSLPESALEFVAGSTSWTFCDI